MHKSTKYKDALRAAFPHTVSILVVVLLHLWRRQMLLSIAGGTICYMLLVQFVF